MISSPGDNTWAIVIVGRADGLVTVSAIQAPLELHRIVMLALKSKARVDSGIDP